MIYYITYIFATATKGRNSFDTSLGVEANSVEEALQNWAKCKPAFMLKNLFNISVQKLVKNSYGTPYKVSCGSVEIIEAFIASYKEAV